MVKLSTLLAAGPAMNRIAKSFKECFDSINMYKRTGDSDYLLRSAWIYIYGVQNSMEKWNFNPFTARIFIPDYQQLGRVSINEALMILISNLTRLGEEAGVNSIIDNITDGGNAYDTYSYLVSADLKDKLKP